MVITLRRALDAGSAILATESALTSPSFWLTRSARLAPGYLTKGEAAIKRAILLQRRPQRLGGAELRRAGPTRRSPEGRFGSNSV